MKSILIAASQQHVRSGSRFNKLRYSTDSLLLEQIGFNGLICPVGAFIPSGEAFPMLR
ncbi:hypothetical protein [Paenibacillus sp. HGF5]|uniref:hypothetical protein n=1 Tax=Paenibacillus sp. HGF5 TaxID=908341 RepID=UPI0034A0C97B